MELLHSRPQGGGDPRSVDIGGEVGLPRILIQGEGVRGTVVAKELRASTEGVEEEHVVLQKIVRLLFSILSLPAETSQPPWGCYAGWQWPWSPCPPTRSHCPPPWHT